MANVRIEPQSIIEAGVTPTYYDEGSDPEPGPSLLNVSDTYQVANNGKVVLHAKKSAAVDCVIAIPTPRTYHGLAIADLALTVPNTTGDKFFGPFDRSLYNNGDGDIEFTLTDVDGLTLAVLKI